jgi:hypothetical protein
VLVRGRAGVALPRSLTSATKSTRDVEFVAFVPLLATSATKSTRSVEFVALVCGGGPPSEDS